MPLLYFADSAPPAQRLKVGNVYLPFFNIQPDIPWQDGPPLTVSEKVHWH